jgi:hypothetical protein
MPAMAWSWYGTIEKPAAPLKQGSRSTGTRERDELGKLQGKAVQKTWMDRASSSAVEGSLEQR